MNEKKLLILRTSFVILSIGIIVLSVIPTVTLPSQQITFLDKIAHFLQYLVLALVYLWYRREKGDSEKLIIRNLSVLAVIFSFGTEVLQLFIPGREFCIYDIVANLLGFFIVIIYLIVRPNKK